MGNWGHKIEIWAKKNFLTTRFIAETSIFGQISDLYFLTIFGKKSKKTAVKSDQKFFSKKFGNSKFSKMALSL